MGGIGVKQDQQTGEYIYRQLVKAHEEKDALMNALRSIEENMGDDNIAYEKMKEMYDAQITKIRQMFNRRYIG